jgi:glycosyltransferase involved in cell wall biosynthesis
MQHAVGGDVRGKILCAYKITSMKDKLHSERGRLVALASQKIKSMLFSVSCSVLGQRSWPTGPPHVKQGFAGEAIGTPVANGNVPLISVIMPVYNACRSNKFFLLRALESIANQTYRNVELVIVDDGSTDDTRQVCEEFLASHPYLRAQYLHKENGGQSAARNFGAAACSGEYVGFLDQDDEWYANKLQTVVPWLSNKSIDVLYTDADIIDGDDKVTSKSIHQNQKYGWPHPKTAVEDVLFKDIFVMPGLMTIRKSAFDAVAGFDEKLSGYEDDDLFLRLFERFQIFYLPVPTLRWRMYGDNYSFSHRMLTSRLYYWKKLLNNYTEQGSDRFRVHMISLRFFWQFMGQSKMQYLEGNALCWQSLRGAKEVSLHIPYLQRAIFSFLFLLPEKMTLPLLVKTNRLIRGNRS